MFEKVDAARRQLSEKLGRAAKMIFMEPCPDPGRAGIIQRWQEAQARMPGVAIYQERVSRERFLQLLTHCSKLVANSSSVFTEAAPLGVPVDLVGGRQKGRVLTTPKARRRPVLDRPLSGGPFGGKGASERIARVIKKFLCSGSTWKPKEFQDITS